eukprot:1854643-Rhodomonas_salina.1
MAAGGKGKKAEGVKKAAAKKAAAQDKVPASVLASCLRPCYALNSLMGLHSRYHTELAYGPTPSLQH